MFLFISRRLRKRAICNRLKGHAFQSDLYITLFQGYLSPNNGFVPLGSRSSETGSGALWRGQIGEMAFWDTLTSPFHVIDMVLSIACMPFHQSICVPRAFTEDGSAYLPLAIADIAYYEGYSNTCS